MKVWKALACWAECEFLLGCHLSCSADFPKSVNWSWVQAWNWRLNRKQQGKNMLGSYLGFQMSKKREEFIDRCKAGPKGLSSSLAITKAQNQKRRLYNDNWKPLVIKKKYLTGWQKLNLTKHNNYQAHGSVALAISIYCQHHLPTCVRCNHSLHSAMQQTKLFSLTSEASFPPSQRCLFNYWESNSSTIRQKNMVALVKISPWLCSKPAINPSLVWSCHWLPHQFTSSPHPSQGAQLGVSTVQTCSECLLSTSHKKDPALP